MTWQLDLGPRATPYHIPLPVRNGSYHTPYFSAFEHSTTNNDHKEIMHIDQLNYCIFFRYIIRFILYIHTDLQKLIHTALSSTQASAYNVPCALDNIVLGLVKAQYVHQHGFLLCLCRYM